MFFVFLIKESSQNHSHPPQTEKRNFLHIYGRSSRNEPELKFLSLLTISYPPLRMRMFILSS